MIDGRIKTLLEVKGRNISELTRHCGVSLTTGYGWLSGAEPRKERKAKIATFFDISVQELEYGSMLSLTPLGTNVKAGVDIAASVQAADMMILAEFDRSPKSAEFKNGMRDYIVFRLSGTPKLSPYSPGTCQADAYDAGRLHGTRLIEKIKVLDQQ